MVQTRVGMRRAHVLGLGAIDRVAENPSARPAVRIHARSTQITDPARADARDQHPVASVKRRHERTHGLDDADAFVPENSAGRDRWDVALQDVKVRAADRRRRDPDHRIPGVANDRLGLRLPGPLAGATVDQRFHHVVRRDRIGDGGRDHVSRPHGQILQSLFRTLLARTSGQSAANHDDIASGVSSGRRSRPRVASCCPALRLRDEGHLTIFPRLHSLAIRFLAR